MNDETIALINDMSIEITNVIKSNIEKMKQMEEVKLFITIESLKAALVAFCAFSLEFEDNLHEVFIQTLLEALHHDFKRAYANKQKYKEKLN